MLKGSVQDIFLIITGILLFAVVSVFALTFMNQLQTTTAGIFGAEATAHVTSGVTFFENMDYMIVFFLFMMFITTLIGAFILDTHPIFFVISLFILIFTVIISAQFANMYVEFSQNSELIAAASHYTLTYHVFTNFPTIITIFGFILAIVIYGKIRSGGGTYSGGNY